MLSIHQNQEELLKAIEKIEAGLAIIKQFLPQLSNEREESKNEVSVSEFVIRKIKGMKSRTFLNKGEAYSKSAIDNWCKFQKVWEAFIKNNHNIELTFNDISMSTYYDFMSFCDSLSFKRSTKYLYVTIFRAALSYAFTDGISNNRLFSNRNFSTHATVNYNDHIYLTSTEISRIASLELEKNSTLDKVRDIFLVGCYTGQRISDYSSISLSDIETIEIDGQKFKVIKKKQKKTGTEVLIPILNANVIHILEKWGGQVPRLATSTINERIKTVCKLSGITDSVKKIECIGGKNVETITSKDRLVSSHTARRSCITNLYLEGKLDTIQIRSISGHKSEQSFYRYLCYSSEESAKKIIQSIRKEN